MYLSTDLYKGIYAIDFFQYHSGAIIFIYLNHKIMISLKNIENY